MARIKRFWVVGILHLLLSGICFLLYALEWWTVRIRGGQPAYPFASAEGAWYMESEALYGNFCLLFGLLFLVSFATGLMAIVRQSKARLWVVFMATILLQLLVVAG
jgi:hypothetical protein